MTNKRGHSPGRSRLLRKAALAAAILCGAVALVACVLTMKGVPQSWLFLKRIEVGEDRTAVIQGLKSSYQAFEQAQFPELDHMLQDFYPKVDFADANEVIVTHIAHDRLGIVVFSRDARVVQRVVVRT